MSSTEFLEDLSSSETSDSRVTYNIEKFEHMQPNM